MPTDPPEVCPKCGSPVIERGELMVSFECGTVLDRDGDVWEDDVDRTCHERQSAQLSALKAGLRELAAKWRDSPDSAGFLLRASDELEALIGGE